MPNVKIREIEHELSEHLPKFRKSDRSEKRNGCYVDWENSQRPADIEITDDFEERASRPCAFAAVKQNIRDQESTENEKDHYAITRYPDVEIFRERVSENDQQYARAILD